MSEYDQLGAAYVIETDHAEAALATLGAKLDETYAKTERVDESTGRLRDALGRFRTAGTESASAVEQLETAFRGLGTTTETAARAARAHAEVQREAAQVSRELNADLRGQEAMERRLAAAREESASAQARQTQQAQGLLARGLGGRRVAQEFAQLQRGIRLASDESAPAATRLMALGGSLGIAGRMGVQAAEAAVRVARALVEEAEAAEATHNQLTTLGGSLDAMRAATGGAITTTEAFAVQQGAFQHGLVASSEQLGVLAEAGRRHARVFGGDAATATRELEAALASNDRNALARFGLSMQSATTSGNRFAGAMAELAQHQRAFGPLAASTAENVDRVKTDFAELGQEIFTAGGRLAALTPVGSAFTGGLHLLVGGVESVTSGLRVLNEATDRFASAEDRARNAAERQNAALQQTKAATDDTARATDGMAGKSWALADAFRATEAALHSYKTQMESLAFVVSEGESAQDGFERRLRNAQTALAQHRAQLAQDRQIVAALRQSGEIRTDDDAAAAGMADVAAADRRSARAGARQARSNRRDLQEEGRLDEATRELERYQHVAERVHAQIVHLQMDAGESAAHWLHREAEAQRAANDNAEELRHKEFENEQRDGENRRHLREQQARQRDEDATRERTHRIEVDEQLRARNGSHDIGRELTQQLHLSVRESETFERSYARNIHSALDSANTAVTAHVSAWITGRESVGTALKGIAHDVLESLAVQGVGQVVFWTAKAVSDAAGVVTSPLVPGDVASIAAWAAVAGLAGLGAAATTPPAAPSAPASSTGSGGDSFRPASTASAGGSGGGDAHVSYTFNISGALATETHIQQAIVRGLDGAARNNMLPRGFMTAVGL